MKGAAPPLNNQRLIVSMTSYPARIRFVQEVVESLKKQTRKPDEVMLYLSVDNFPEKEAALPRIFRALIQDHDITVRWVDGDLKSHKKYYYAFREFPEDLIVTVDDDVYYAPDLLDSLWRTHERFPGAVAAGRADLITLDRDGRLRPGHDWLHRTMGFEDSPGMQLMALGVGGVLYDPSLFPEQLFDEDAISRLCPEEDDLWLKAVEALAGIPVVRAPLSDIISIVPGSQSVSPLRQRGARPSADEVLGQILSHLSPGENLLEKAIRVSADPRVSTMEELLSYVESDKRRYAAAIEARNGLETDEYRRTIAELRAENERIFDLREHERDMNIAKNAEIEKLRETNREQKERFDQEKQKLKELRESDKEKYIADTEKLKALREKDKESFAAEKEKLIGLREKDKESFAAEKEKLINLREQDKAHFAQVEESLKAEIERQAGLREHEKEQNLAKNQQIEQLRADQKQRLAELREEHVVRVTELKKEHKQERDGLRQQVAMLRYCLDHPVLSRVDKTKQTLFPKKKEAAGKKKEK